MNQNPNLPSSIADTIPWNPAGQAIWVASSLILRRNLSRHHFPSKLQSQEADQVLQNIKTAFENNPEFQNPHFTSQNELSAADRDLILEHFLFLKGFQESPNGSGVIIDDKGYLLTLINTGNHLEMRALNFNSSWEETWNTLAKIETELNNALEFAFSPKFGYLTADPAQCGTGLTVYAYLHLPALIHSGQLDSALANAHEEDVTFMGLSGDLVDLVGDLVVIQNNFSIGMSEEAILHAIQTAAGKLIGAEKNMRSHLKEEQNTEVKDLISKAFGLMVHSYQLDTKEALNLLSLMKLGLALDYISGTSEEKLNPLFFKSRRGHLMHFFPELKEAKDVEQKRAEYLQRELSGISLNQELQ